MDDLASAWINQGIALMRTGDTAALRQSVTCFDKAIELRTPLLSLGEPLYRYNLAGVWLNRGDARSALGEASSRLDSIADYDEAIRLVAGMGPDHRFESAHRLALAHLNRGTALLASGDERDVVEAHGAFDASISALIASREMCGLMAASAWEGKAEAALRQGRPEDARTSAQRAMELVSGNESTSLDALKVSLKARIAFCVGCWGASEKANLSPARRVAVLAGLDATDEGLRLALAWPDAVPIAPLIRELFRFGSTGFALVQPQFLCEFVKDFVGVWPAPGLNADLRALAGKALRNVMGGLASEGILKAGLSEEEIRKFAELRTTLEDLEKWAT
jgi:tetratricopeptide (TPR) repeat protein